jgi:hypothetical protein
MATKKVTSKGIAPYKCLPLEPNLAPKWTSVKDFERWHSAIWKWPVDPANFGAAVFTPTCVMEGPRERDRIGPVNSKIIPPANVRAANFFWLVFKTYPKLSGEHISWAYNDTQVFINWCFVTTKGREELRVPALDVFCIDGGKVAYRLTEFDMNNLQEALKTAYGKDDAPAEAQLGMSYLWTRSHLEPVLPPVLARR